MEAIKTKEREGWKQKKVKGVVETIGSHSFGSAMLGWILAIRENMDKEKIIKLLLVHDLVMACMPDITPKDSDYARKKEIENSKIRELLEKIPEELKDEFRLLITEYQSHETPESRLAREADKLDTLLQAFFYSKREGRWEIAQEFLNSYARFIKSKTGKETAKELENIIRGSAKHR